VRLRATDDRRQVLVKLTHDGEELLEKLALHHLRELHSVEPKFRNVLQSLMAVNLLNAARSFGASEWMVFKTVVVPSTVPFILTGLRLALGRALVGVMVGELYAATAGIGFMITVAGATFQTDKVFVGVLIFALSGMIGMELLTKLERRFDKWRPQVGS
jgi:ABC-type nitrate/sulfonate/bicarbonate transport system permease component